MEVLIIVGFVIFVIYKLIQSNTPAERRERKMEEEKTRARIEAERARVDAMTLEERESYQKEKAKEAELQRLLQQHVNNEIKYGQDYRDANW